jgi:hypothetical protein
LVPQPQPDYNHQHQPANNSDHGGLRFFAFFRAPDGRRNVCRCSKGESQEAVSSEKEEEGHYHLELLQTSLALAASTKTGALATA